MLRSTDDIFQQGSEFVSYLASFGTLSGGRLTQAQSPWRLSRCHIPDLRIPLRINTF